MNWCFAPEYTPSKPSRRKRLTKSPCLHGFQRLMGRLHVQVNTVYHRQRVSQLQAEPDPIFQSRTQLRLALTQRRAERDHARTHADPSRESPVIQLVVLGPRHRPLHVLAQDELHAHNSLDSMFQSIPFSPLKYKAKFAAKSFGPSICTTRAGEVIHLRRANPSARVVPQAQP